jgi:hypothetical protein
MLERTNQSPEIKAAWQTADRNSHSLRMAWRNGLNFRLAGAAYRQRDRPLGPIQFPIGILPGLSNDPRYKLLLRKMNFPDCRTSGRFAASNFTQ